MTGAISAGSTSSGRSDFDKEKAADRQNTILRLIGRRSDENFAHRGRSSYC